MAQQYSQPQSRRGGRNRFRQNRDSYSSRWRPFPDDDSRRDWPSGDRGWPERDYQDDSEEWTAGRQSGGGYGGPASYEYRGRERGREDEGNWSDREFAGDRSWERDDSGYGSSGRDRDDSRQWNRGGGQYGQGGYGGGSGGSYGQGSYQRGGQGQRFRGEQQGGSQSWGSEGGGGQWGSQGGQWGSPGSVGQYGSFGSQGGGDQWSSQAGQGQYGSQGGGQWGSRGSQGGQWGSSQGYGSQSQSQSQSRSSRHRNMGPKGYQRSDERLKDDVCERLMQSGIDASDVSVQVQSGKVSLEGTVPDRSMKHAIEDLVDNCIGVKEIDNRLRVGRGSESDSDSGSGSGSESSRSSRGATSGSGSSSANAMAGSVQGGSSSGRHG